MMLRYLIAGLFLIVSGRQELPLGGIPISTGCTTSADVLNGTNNQSVPLGSGSGTTYGAFSFTAGSSYTLCAVQIPLKKTGTPSYTLAAYVYSDSSNAPSSLIGTGSASINTSTLTTSYTNITFTGLSAALTSSTQYWIVIVSTSAPNDSTNFANWGSTGSLCTPYFAISTSGSAWASGGACITGILTTYHH